MIPQKLRNFSSGRNVLIFVALWLGFSIYLFNFGPYTPLRSAGQGAPLLEETFGVDVGQIDSRLALLGPDGRSLYLWFQVLDFVNAFLAAVAMTFLLVFVYRRLIGHGNPAGLLVFLPVLLFAVEVAENALLINAIAGHPEPGVAISTLGTVTVIKFGFNFLIGPVLIIGLVVLAIKTARTRRKRGAE